MSPRDLVYVGHMLDMARKAVGKTRGVSRETYDARFYYDTITQSPTLLRLLIDQVGIDRIMLGSDYCFDMGYEHPREVIDALKLRPAERDKIYSGNAARVLGL